MPDTKMVKTVGEHWACAELARRGWAPALTRDGLERTDILAVASHLPQRPTVEVQVKTASGSSDNTSWPLGTKAQQPAASDREWFLLVLVPSVPETLRCFVVPRNHVAAAAWIEHMAWLTDPSAPPGTRNAPVDRARVKAATFAGYEDRWELLDSPTDHIAPLLPSKYRVLGAQTEIGLPPGHPWTKSLPEW